MEQRIKEKEAPKGNPDKYYKKQTEFGKQKARLEKQEGNQIKDGQEKAFEKKKRESQKINENIVKAIPAQSEKSIMRKTNSVP